MGAPYVQHRGDGCDRKCHRIYCTYVHYTSKKSTRTRKAKKVHHLRTLQSARAATCLVHPFPACPARGKEGESGTRRLAALTVGHATVERLPVAISELFP